MGTSGFTHNEKEYQDAIDYLETEPTKKIEEKKQKEEQKRKEEEKQKQMQEEINKQTETEQPKVQEEVAPTEEIEEESEEETDKTDEVDNTNNLDNKNYSPKNENDLKKSKPEWKTIQLIITENEKSLVEGTMKIFIRNDYVHSYSMIPKAPEESSMPIATRQTRLRKVLAYIFTDVMDAGQRSGVIKDFDEQYPNVVSLYFSQITDNENDSSCTGFIINYNGSFIALGPTFDQDMEKIKQSGASGQGGIVYSFDSFINELNELTAQFGLTQIKKFSDFGQAEGFILENTAVKKKISLNEAIAGPAQTYNTEEEKAKEDKKKEPLVQLYTLRVHYDSKNPNAVEALEQFIKDIKNDIIQYNPNL